MLAPKESRLHKIGVDDWSITEYRDKQNRIFLNYPPAVFKIIVDHFRMIHNASSEDKVFPPRVLWEHKLQIEEVALDLGVRFDACISQNIECFSQGLE